MGLLVCPPVWLLLWEAMLPQLQLMLQLQLTRLPQLMSSTPMRFPPTHTHTLLLMTTQRLTSMPRSHLMVPEMLKELTLLLFPMAESRLLPTLPMDMMVMLPMLPTPDRPSTQNTPHPTRLPQLTRLLQLMPQPQLTSPPQSTKPLQSQPTLVRQVTDLFDLRVYETIVSL